LRTDHAVHDFVDRTVAAERENEVGSIADGLLGDTRRVIGSGCGSEPGTQIGESLGGSREQTRVSPKFAGCWIVNENRVLIRCDSSSIPLPLRTGLSWCDLQPWPSGRG
jgi:hypothetical protein